MTKEEYERLLKSDYWKGFSYSLIKERGFICEDCGRVFYNQRNRLQVHHLVYRDINPWSYKPEEMIVLCEECHKKRHGINPEPELITNTTNSNESFGVFSSSYSDLNENRKERTTHINSYSETDRWGNVEEKIYSRDPYPIKPQSRFKWKYVLYGLLLLFALSFGWNKLKQQTSDNSKEQIEVPTYQSSESEHVRVNNSMLEANEVPQTIDPKSYESPDANPEASKVQQTIDFKSKENYNANSDVSTNGTIINEHSEPTKQRLVVDNPTITPSTETTHKDKEPQKLKADPPRKLSTIEMLERRNHEEVVKQAIRAGVSTEGSTIEILERINHAEVVKQAKRAGVSTEGSTTDILERISHAEVVKQAKRAGVSTEGSTTDILERINHAEVVKQAKRAGVSTEGSTIDILERINRKELEKMKW